MNCLEIFLLMSYTPTDPFVVLDGLEHNLPPATEVAPSGSFCGQFFGRRFSLLSIAAETPLPWSRWTARTRLPTLAPPPPPPPAVCSPPPPGSRRTVISGLINAGKVLHGLKSTNGSPSSRTRPIYSVPDLRSVPRHRNAAVSYSLAVPHKGAVPPC